MIGRTIAQYKILEELGQGGMGVVYKARDLRLNRLAALKVLRPDRIASPNGKLRFVQEAQAASALNHPNIITIYDINTENGVEYIAMEFVEGQTLEEVIHAKQGLAFADTLKLAAQISGGLAAAHEAGIIHRDLKPGNIMVSPHGQVKILDFGLAKLVDRTQARSAPIDSETDATLTLVDPFRDAPLTEEGAIMGTLAYMSPEQAEGKKLDPRSDVFSFGSMLYEMTTGQRAFQGESKVSTLSAILRDEPKPLRQLASAAPPEMERIVARCMRKDPDRRFQHMSEARIALEDLRQESESGTLRITAQPAATAVAKRGNWLLPAGMVAAVIAVAGYWALRPAAPGQPLTVTPLTTYPGEERHASFSPDGNQVVFAWGDDEENSSIYVKLIGPGTPLRLTKQDENSYGPAWSPDGRSIAFLRSRNNKSEIILMPALGGQERKVGEVVGAKLIPGPMLVWSPEGKWLATVECKRGFTSCGLLLFSVETGEKRTLTSPPREILGDGSPAFSHDGRKLAFSRNVLTTVADLYELDLDNAYTPKGEPRRITFDNSWTPNPAWTPSGKEIIFSTGQWQILNLMRMRTDKANKPTRLASVGEGGGHPVISRDGRRLIYEKDNEDLNIWRADVSSARGNVPPVKLVSSTRGEHHPMYSPDGNKIAYSSNQSGSWEIWVCDSDGSNTSQLTSLGSFTRAPAWSPDGAWIAFDSRVDGQADIYVMGSQGGKPRKLTNNPANDLLPTWSSDGKVIYFTSYRGGRPQLWKMLAAGGDATQITKGGGFGGRSLDGKFLYYTKPGGDGLWRVPVDGGEEVLMNKTILSASNIAVGRQGVYYLINEKASHSIWFVDFATGQTKRIRAVEKLASWGISLSPDERWLLYTQQDQSGSDLMLVENFR